MKPLREMTREEQLNHVRKAVPVELQSVGDALEPGVLCEITRYLDNDIERLVRAVAYLDARELGRNHAQAVKVSNTKVRQIRRVLGYAITRDLSF